MIGDIVIADKTYYLQCNKEGTLRKISAANKVGFFKKFWLEFRDKFKKWSHEEALAFVMEEKK